VCCSPVCTVLTGPRVNHSEAVKRIRRYLSDSAEKGIEFMPTQHSFRVWAAADYGGLYDKETAADQPVTAKSRTGFLITYADCPLIWDSQLQTDTALSITEAEYIALRTALRHTIPLMKLIKEIKTRTNIHMHEKPAVYCTVFKDNSGSIE
jgi:hypothetical protein